MTIHESRRRAPCATLFVIASSLALLSVVAPASADHRSSCGAGGRWDGSPAGQVFGWWTRAGSRARQDPFDRGYEAGERDGARAGRNDARAGRPFRIGPYADLGYRRPRFRAGYHRAYVAAYATAYERVTVRRAKRRWQRHDHGQREHGQREHGRRSGHRRR